MSDIDVQPGVTATTKADVSTITKPMIVNTVLTFLKYGINTATDGNILKAAVTAFSIREIKDAVTSLWDGCQLGKIPNFRASANRTQSEAVICELLKMLRQLESQKIMPILLVDAVGLARLPKFKIEELNEVAIVERLQQMEMKLLSMDSTINQHTDDISEMNTTLSNNVRAEVAQSLSEIKHPQQAIAVEDIKEPDAHQDQNTLFVPITTVKALTSDTPPLLCDNDFPSLPGSNPAGTTHMSTTTTTTNISTPAMMSTMSPGDHHNKQFSEAVGALKNNRKDWVTIRRGRGQQKTPRLLQGKATHGKIKAAPVPTWDIYISGIHKDITTDTLTEHLTSNGITVVNLVRLSPADSNYARYHLTVPMTCYALVFNEDLWEVGTYVSRYYTPKSK